MSNLEQKLASLTSSKRMQDWDSAAKARVKSRVMASVRSEAAQAAPASTLWFVSQFVSRPLTIGTAAFVLLTGGWSATVSAAAGSLPGDSLYSVKRITEEAQLRLASRDRQAVLHTEFASRRLEEAEALVAVSASRPEAKALAHQALAAYKDEITQAAAAVVEMKEGTDPASKAVVANVGTKITELSAALDKTVVAQEQSSTEVGDVKEAVAGAASTAAAAVVDVHEADATKVSQQELRAMFTTLLSKVQSRQLMNKHRIDVMRAAMDADLKRFTGVAGVPTDEDLKAAAAEIEASKATVNLALDALALSNFRSAFEQVESADKKLLALEKKIAAWEFAILSAPEAGESTPPPAPVTAPVPAP